MTISVASGKGGTGKTTVAASLVSVIPESVYIDCDVEEPNGHLLLKPNIITEALAYKLIPEINYAGCNSCNKCLEVCEYNALLNFKTEIFLLDTLCHSCGACAYFCPQNAITEIKKKIGVIRNGQVDDQILFYDAYLKIGEESATPLIKQLKNAYRGNRTVVVDSPPGTSCSMSEVVKDSDYCILVTESTPFGINDLKLAVNVLLQIGVPFGIVINKYDKTFTQLEEYIALNNLNILLKIPFSIYVAESYSKGELPATVIKDYRQMMEELLEKIKREIVEANANAG